VSVTVADGTASLVAKVEPVEKIERALASRRPNEARLANSIPALFGSSLDEPAATGILSVN
jgi:hypothetical protein